jgi:hypothetical protein
VPNLLLLFIFLFLWLLSSEYHFNILLKFSLMRCYHLNITKFRFNNYQETSKKTQRNTHLISSCSYNRLHDQLFKNNKTVNKRSFIEIYKYHIIVKCDWQPNKMLKWYSELIFFFFFFWNTLKKYVHNTYKQWSIFCKWLTTIVCIGDLSWFWRSC